MEERMKQTEQTERLGIFQHLREALEADEASEKDYHIRQTLQLLGIEDLED